VTVEHLFDQRGSVSGLTLTADVLVIGGGPAGAWAALLAAAQGAKVVLVEKGFLGTGGATAAGNTTTIHTLPGSDEREAAIQRRMAQAFGLAKQDWVERIIEDAFIHLNELADWGYPFPSTEDGVSYRGSLRGADYLRFMRRLLRKADVKVLDKSPALELLTSDGVVVGAAGTNRVSHERWTVRSGAVVVATGGCAFRSNALGTNGLTGDGYLLSAEAGAVFSGMEFTGQYGIAPAFSSVTKGIIYFWATFTDADGNVLERKGDRQAAVARHLMTGPVYAVLDQASPRVQEGMRRGQPNIFVPFDRKRIDPFTQRFPITLRYEGTVRGVGGLVIDATGATTVPGLFAAGDAASRENFVGATTGGGGPNSSWAMSTGARAGQAAAAFAAALGLRAQERRAQPAGVIGLRPAGPIDKELRVADVIAAVQQEILPLDRSYFRTGAALAASQERLNDLWREARAGFSASGDEVSDVREAASMIATARWIVASAMGRPESRGINRRLDFPNTDPAQQHRLTAGGLDKVWVEPETAMPRAMAS